MKIYYLSDPHINHHVLFNPNQIKWENLTKKFVNELFIAEDSKESMIVIAGDFSEWNVQSKWLLEELSVNYKYVIGVIGNHDLYLITEKQKKKYKNNSMNRANELLKMTKSLDNVYLLQNELITLDGIKIAGTRLWYMLTSPKDIEFFNHMSNDSNYIFPNTYDFYKDYNREDIEFYNSLDFVDVMITHVPPVHPKFSPYPYSECYTTKVDELKTLNWICGHQHLKGIEKILDTNLYINSLGYPSEKLASSFKLEFFEI